MSSEKRLGELRDRIDALDDELLDLLGRRASLTVEVGEVKRAAAGPDEVVRFYRPDREAEILRRLVARNPGLLPDEDLVRIMREVISSCLALEQALSVAYLGPEGTYTHAAALKHFGGATTQVPLGGIAEVFREVENRASDYGVVPIENSIEGSVNETLDCLGDSSLTLCGEIVLPIHHQLLGRNTALAAVERVCAHAQALAQCRGWLDRHVPGAERLALASNAQAAERAAREPGTAAVAGSQAAERYGLEVLAANIEDHPHNTTRFAVIGHDRPRPTGDDVTSVMFSMPNEPGALHGMLSVLADAGISMTRIESRPLRGGSWDYRFFIDLLGHRDDAAVAPALDAMAKRAALFEILGSCPRAVL